MPVLFILFIVMPIVEITLLIQVGQLIGAWYTVGLVVLSAFIGVNMLRQQGLSTLMRAQSKMNAGNMPGQEMVEGIILAVGGALLVTPGFVTDFVGFCCLIPATRSALVKLLVSRFTVVAASSSSSSRSHSSSSYAASFSHVEEEKPFEKPNKGPKRSGDVIEGEYRVDD